MAELAGTLEQLILYQCVTKVDPCNDSFQGHSR